MPTPLKCSNRFWLIAIIVLTALAGCRTPAAPQAQAPVDPPPDAGWEQRYADRSIDVELPEPFVRLVDLGRLRVGMTKAEVLAIFPDPEEYKLQGTDEFWQYPYAQLIFRNGRLRDWFNR